MYYTFKAPIGYFFETNQGLRLDQSRCIDSETEYTILFTVRLDYTNSFRRLLSSEGWGDKGLFVKDARYGFYPSTGGMQCDIKIKAGYNYQYGVTRASDGTVKLFINGYKCAEGRPTSQRGFEINKDDLTFFHDTHRNYASKGVVRRIQIWGETLNETTVADKAGCVLLNTSGAQCEDGAFKLFHATRNDVDFSSVRDRDDFGTGWGRGYNVFSPEDWAPSRAEFGEWIQFDLGKKRSVAGLMMNGAWAHHWMTASYKVMVSADQETWYEIECGRIFEGTGVSGRSGYRHHRSGPTPEWFQKPVIARFLRVYPLTWHGNPGGRLSVMICGDCEEGACESNSLTSKQELSSINGGNFAAAGSYLVSNNAQYVLKMQVMTTAMLVHVTSVLAPHPLHVHWLFCSVLILTFLGCV